MATLIETGQQAPAFSLPDLNGNVHALGDYRGQVVVINFWSAECPWAERADQEILPMLEKWGEQVVLLAIAANANEPVDLLKKVAAERGLPVVLRDEDQRVADLYGAKTTPHLFVVDPQGVLRYQGAPNDVTFRQREPTRPYLQDAMRAVLAGREPDPAETPSYGCTLVRHAP